MRKLAHASALAGIAALALSAAAAASCDLRKRHARARHALLCADQAAEHYGEPALSRRESIRAYAGAALRA